MAPAILAGLAIFQANELFAQDNFSQNAINTIIGDLEQEIADGSTAAVSVSGTIYSPISAGNTVPALVGSTGTGGLENLVKRSANALPFSSGANASNRAAPINSATNPSLNNSFVSPARWNTPLLLPKSPASTTDFTPVLSSGTFTAPDWVLVAADGSNPTSWNSTLISTGSNANPVVGRYAYAIYDEGGLLDANVAGYPLTSAPPYTSSNSDPRAAGKGVLSFADLTQLPGISSLGSETQSKVINALVGWRNYATSQPGGSFPNYTFTAGSSTNYANSVLSNTAGFLHPSTTVFNGQSDQMFTSRQQLITFLTQSLNPLTSSTTDIANLQTALQYLTHFTRELNAPTFTPTLLSGSSNAAVNPALTSVCFQTAGTLADGTQVSPGMPLVRKRFSLRRLGWITARGPSADLPVSDPQYNADGSDANILLYFGLQATGVGTYKTWSYRPNGSAPASSILTLQQVAALNPPRDPDYFELLKAALLQGSLGQYYYGDAVTASYERDINTDVHVMQIGANLITQYSPDGLPAIISFTNNSAASSSDYNSNNIRGVANLPYLYQIGFLVYRAASANPKPSGNNPRPNVAGWLVPRLWNPHQWLAPPNPNLQLRLVATGGTWTWQMGVGTIVSVTFTPTAANSTITFGDSIISSTNQESIFAEPALIPPANVTASSQNGGLGATCSEASPAYALYNPSGFPSGVTEPAGTFLNFTGIPFGVMNCPDYRIGSPGTTADGGAARILQSGVTTFEMQYSPDGGQTFLPYQRFDVYSAFGGGNRDERDVFNYGGGSVYDVSFGISGTTCNANGAPINLIPTIQNGFFIDPRTPRLGMGLTPNASFSASPWYGPQPWYLTSSGGGGAIYNPLSTWYNHPYSNDGASGMFTPNLAGGSPGANPATPFYPGFYSVNFSSQISTPPAPSPAPPNPPFQSVSTYYTDPDGVARRGDGDQANDVHPTFTSAATYTDVSGTENATFAQAVPSNRNVPRIEDRPLILNRAFQSVGEMGYASRDVPWKSLDFFSADSADAGLLDVFSISDNTVVAGRVNLNTKQRAVLQAVLNGTLRSELSGTGASRVTIDPVASASIANFIVGQTTGAAGPLMNRSQLATQIVASGSFPLSDVDPNSDYIKTRREATVRALAEAGQTRTWNLMIDLISQNGQYPAGSAGLDQFLVSNSQRYWVHLAIDRYTGEVLDQSIETVPEAGPTAIALSSTTVAEYQPVGTPVSILNGTDAAPNSLLAYSLVSGSGSTDNASFVVINNTLSTSSTFQYLTQWSYNIRLCVSDQNGLTFEQPVTIQVLPGPYTKWKIKNFNSDANNAAVAGDNANPAGDRISNLLKYAMGLDPFSPAITGITESVSGGVMTMNYALATSASDVTVQALWSSDLKTWSVNGVTQTINTDNGTTQLWQATVPVNPQIPRMFIRLQVTGP